MKQYESEDAKRFWANLEEELQGEIAAIHIVTDGFEGISHQSCDFLEAIIEYADRMYCFEHEENGEMGAINIGVVSSLNAEHQYLTVKPAIEESIRFEKVFYEENGDVGGIVYRWGDTWLFVFTSEYNLILTRSSFDLSDPNGWPEAPIEPALFC